jgi:dTDP-4-dehydrorhamnose reductase
MRVLITGAAGQVGTVLRSDVPGEFSARSLTRAELDIADETAVRAAVSDWRPDLIVNAAAYTAVDRAESEPDKALAINADGPKFLARAAACLPRCRLIHISTDYVFDGRSAEPYKPTDTPDPIGAYGRSKFLGEQEVLKVLNENAVILRTAWVYAPHGKNFLLTMLRLMKERGEVRVVADQQGCPTCASSIAAAIWAIARQSALHGVLHWTDGGRTTWYEFALAIAEEGRQAGILPGEVQVVPITTADYPTVARRPANSVLDISDTISRVGIVPPHWRTGLHDTIARLASA